MYQITLDTYINFFPSIANYILKSSSRFASTFVTNISYPFHFSSKPHLTSAFSRHILYNVYDWALHISVMFQKNGFDFLSAVSRYNYLNLYQITNFNTSLFRKLLQSGHVKCRHAICTHKPKRNV